MMKRLQRRPDLRIRFILIAVLGFIISVFFGLAEKAIAQEYTLKATSQPIPASAKVKVWETDGILQYRRGPYRITFQHDRNSSAYTPRFRLTVADEGNGRQPGVGKITYNGSCVGPEGRFAFVSPSHELRTPGSALNRYFETNDFLELKIGSLIKVAQEALSDQCPRIKNILVRSSLKLYRSSAGTDRIGYMSADNDWVFRAAGRPLTVEINANTKAAEDKGSVDQPTFLSANGVSIYEYGGYKRQATAYLTAECDRQMSMGISELAVDPRADTNYNAYSGDIGGDNFPLKPIVDAMRMLAHQKCSQLETLEIKVNWRDARNITGERYFYVRNSSDWRIAGGLGSECRTIPFVPPAGEVGLLPVNDLCPNYYLVLNDKEIAPKRDWSVYVRNKPVVYELLRLGSDKKLITTASSLGKCPDGRVDLDLVISAADFGGEARAFEMIHNILVQDDYSDALNRLLYRLMRQYQYCHEDAPNQRLPQFKYRVLSKADPDKVFGEIEFFHLLEEADDGRELPTFVNDRHPVIVKRREVARKITELNTNGIFAGYPGGVYLSAIHAGEFDVVAELDERSGAVAEAFAKRFDAAQILADIQALFTLQLDRSDEFRKAYEVVLSEYTLSHAAMATYVLSFGELYKDCLGPNPAGKIVTREVQEVLIDGGGFRVPIGPAQRSTREYWVKKDLGYMLHFYGDEQGLAVTGLVSNFLTGPNGITKTSINSGVLRAMRSYPCSSPEMLRFEENLRKFWIERHSHLKPYTDKIGLGSN